MTENNHTPGPYIIALPGGPAGPFWSIINQRGITIAMQITSKEDAIAIVKGLELLNSASDLLEACEAARTVVDSQESRAVWQLLSNAIAKAKGR